MSRYLFPLVAIVFLLLAGCASRNGGPQPSGGYESFEFENDYIIHALYYKEHGEYAKAYAIFEELYKKTRNPEYRIEAIKLLIAAKDYVKAHGELTELIKRDPRNPVLYRLMTIVQLRLGKADEAEKSARKLLTLEPENPQNTDLLASIYLVREENGKAYEIYDKYYKKHHDNATAVKMATILFHKFKKPQEAIRLLETHSKMVGCSENICLFLAELYRRANDLEHLADVYERLYRTTHSTEYAQKAAEIYAYKKLYDRAEKLLEESHADDRLLLAIYKHTRKFDKASKLARSLYEETGDPLWLAEYGILIYESARNKKDPEVVKKVVRTLSEALKEGVDDPLYYNYLGYLLIDLDIDVKWGLELVKKALAVEPDSAFYIDSLAWGHYKLGECKKAYEEMKKVVDKLGLKDEEIKTHWEKIEKCRSRKK